MYIYSRPPCKIYFESVSERFLWTDAGFEIVWQVEKLPCLKFGCMWFWSSRAGFRTFPFATMLDKPKSWEVNPKNTCFKYHKSSMSALHPMCNWQGGSYTFSNPNRIRNLHVDKDPDTLDVFYFPKAKAISFSWFWSMGAWAAEMARELRDSKREVVKTDHRRVHHRLRRAPSKETWVPLTNSLKAYANRCTKIVMCISFRMLNHMSLFWSCKRLAFTSSIV